MNEVMTIDEAAEMLSLTTVQVVSWIYDNRLRVDAIGADGTIWLVTADVLSLQVDLSLDERLLDRQPEDPDWSDQGPV